MTTLAQAWIEAAYNRSSANDPGKLAQDAELLDHLNRVYQRFYAVLAKARPDQTASESSVTMIGTPATATIPDGTIALLRVSLLAGTKVHLIPASEADRGWHIAPCVMQIGSTLRTRNLGGDPLNGAGLTLLRLDAPTALSALTTVIDARFPERHHQLCIDALALYLDTKDDGRSTEEHTKIVGEYQTALSTFASEYNLPPDALEWAHAPVSRSPVSS